MSHFATNWAMKQRGLKPASRVVLFCLADRHNPDFGCFPMQKTLAEDCEMSRSTLNLHLDKLEELGLIRRDTGRTEDTKQQRPTRYFFAFEDANPVSENKTLTMSENRTVAAKAVSEKQQKPCPIFIQSRVLKSDSIEKTVIHNPVSEPVSTGEPSPPPRTKPPDKSRLPDDWALSDEGWAYARSQQLPDKVIEDEARGFHAYWTDRRDRDAAKSFRGWGTCWEGWCRRIAPRYANRGGMAGKATAGGYGQRSSLASIAARRRVEGEV